MSEDNLARRVKQERTERGWSQEHLAALMTGAGARMHQSSIAKIERPGTDRRPITVDEALAFATVFGTGLPELLISPEAYRDQRVAQLERELERTESELAELESTRQALLTEWIAAGGATRTGGRI
jgi:transcriptional regulator with XRE-family HTH domain